MRRVMEAGEAYRTRLVPGLANTAVAQERNLGVEV